ncbi:hypothetical protein FA15DRAFT_662044 [Coprinopsis marcescibilis]|uniref:Uncharacterized protein n=1 Tax=Coprinopsis marcescibilis TaxID=230819 RepID=A0A5C3K9P1_COPMA|nr:hypothetical protein FA15DRAFT_662044 [Coprinopsis marcescibilis]
MNIDTDTLTALAAAQQQQQQQANYAAQQVAYEQAQAAQHQDSFQPAQSGSDAPQQQAQLPADHDHERMTLWCAVAALGHAYNNFNIESFNQHQLLNLERSTTLMSDT